MKMEKVMERPFSNALDQLRNAGLRPTRQRLALAKLLFGGHDRHISAEQLHSEALNHKIRVSLATVYNTLHQFTDAGLLREIAVDSGCSYFDTNISDHHHFFFSDKGLLQDVEGGEITVSHLPEPPEGTVIDRVDIVIRLRG